MKHPLAKCALCGGGFYPKSSRHRFCSAQCREDWQGAGAFWIFERDDFRCFYCGRTSYEDGAKLVVDHLTTLSEGGKTEAGNLVTSCYSCNAVKGKRPVRAQKALQAVASKRNAERGVSDTLRIRIRKPKRYRDEGTLTVPGEPEGSCDEDTES